MTRRPNRIESIEYAPAPESASAIATRPYKASAKHGTLSMRPKPTAMIGAARIAVGRVKIRLPARPQEQTFQAAQPHSKDAWRRFRRRAPTRSKDAATAAPIHPTPEERQRKYRSFVFFIGPPICFVDPKSGFEHTLSSRRLDGLGGPDRSWPQYDAWRVWEWIGWRFGLRCICAALVFGSNAALALDPDRAIDEFQHTAWTSANGVPSAFGPSRNLPTDICGSARVWVFMFSTA